MAGYITKGITLSYKETQDAEWTALTCLQEIPEISRAKESIETTRLCDEAHTFIPGLIGMPESFDFTCLYQKEEFNTLSTMADTQKEFFWQIGLPDGDAGAVSTKCNFQGACSVKLNSMGVNAAMQFTLSIAPSTSVQFEA